MEGRDKKGRFVERHTLNTAGIREKISKTMRDYWMNHPEARERASKRRKGKHHSEETKRKLSELQKGKKHSRETKEKLSRILKGKHVSKETREKMSRATKERFKNPENHPWYGRRHTEETRGKISRSIKKYFKDNPQAIEQMSKVQKEHYMDNPKRREKISNALKGRRTSIETEFKKGHMLWQDGGYVKKLIDGLNVKPNKQELQLSPLIQIAKPNEFAYNGDFSLGISIGGKIPDWVNVNGKKEVIELFGVYWHSPLKNPRINWNRTYKATINHYKKYGWKCLIIWDYELENSDKVIEKIKTF